MTAPFLRYGMSKRYKAVLFDLFSTVALWDVERLPTFEWQGRTSRSTMGVLQTTLAEAATDVPFAHFFDAMTAVNQELAERRARDMREIPSLTRFELALHGAGMAGSEDTRRLAQHLSHKHMECIAQVTAIPAAHVEFLQRIYVAYPAALVSNFDHAPTARLIMERDGAAAHFHHIVISDDHGWRKPHPKIFHDTLALLDVAPVDALFVGDSFEDDVVGAHGVGMDIAWVNAREAEPPQATPAPDYTVRAIPELASILLP